MREDSRNRMFPVGLYGTLLVGLVGITFPELIAPVENAACTLVSLPLRAYSILLNEQPVLAARRPPSPEGVGEARAERVLEGALGPEGYAPLVCQVIDRRRPNLGGAVDELVLSATRAELADCAPLVTTGNGLVGFLDLDGPPQEYATVRLLSYRSRESRDGIVRPRSPERPARVAAEVECREEDAQGTLHFLVEPARSAGKWPLRCSMLDDAYLASRLRHSGSPVVTSLQTEDPLLPPGLRVGTLMIWGYPKLDIPVGLFVQPVCDGRAINTVALWRPGDATETAIATERQGELLGVHFSRLPAPRPALQQWMVTAPGRSTLPDGAALIDRGRFLGVLRQPWSGQSLVSRFGRAGRTWSLLLLVQGRITEIVARLIPVAGDERLRLQLIASETGSSDLGLLPPMSSGELFTGVNGPHCPAGFYVGTLERGRGEELLLSLDDAEVVQPQVYIGPTGEVR